MGDASRTNDKPTRMQLEDRVERTRQLLAEGNRKHVIKKVLKQAYGVSAATCERYLRRARDLILEETGKPASEHRADAFAFYETLKADKSLPAIVRLKAQERVDKLLALELPVKLTLTDPSGENPMTVRLEAAKLVQTLPEDDLQKLAAAYDLVERLNANKGN